MTTAIATETVTEEVILVEDRRRQHAERYGLEVDRVHAIQLDLQRLRELGTLVDIDIHGTSMFTGRATYAELGIPKNDLRRTRLKAGSKDLIPKLYIGRLRSLEVRFRQSLEKHSYPIGAFGSYRWVPYTAYHKWREEWDALQVEWAELKQEILDHYDEFVDRLADDFRAIAGEAWAALRARSPNAVIVLPDAAFEPDEYDEFVDYIVARAIAKLPSREAIEAGLYVDYRTALVLGQADIEADALARERLRQEREREAMELRAEQEHQALELRQKQMAIWEKEQEARLRIAAEEAKLRAMHEAELEHARQQMREMVSPFQEIFDQLRAQIHDNVMEILDSVRKLGYVHGKISNERIPGLVELFKLLNVHGDDELEAALQELQARLSAAPPAGDSGKRDRVRDSESIAAQLQAIANLTLESAEAVKRSLRPSRASVLEV